MTPLSDRLWQGPMSNKERDLVGRMLSGAQFFTCRSLEPIIKIRSQMEDSKWVMSELLAAELPASRSWMEFDPRSALLISNDSDDLAEGEKYACLSFIEFDSGKNAVFEFRILRDGGVRIFDTELRDNLEIRRMVTQMIRSTWFSIEAMQTPGGLCHRVEHRPSRQQIRNAKRTGKPCHKFVEIRLGRGAKIGGGSNGRTGRTVAWHYRRGHRINHPNPNFPKWRKGCWVGDTDAGIITHNYVVEVPE